MPPSAAQQQTMKRLAGEVDRLQLAFAQADKKIIDLNAKISDKTIAFHKATSDSSKRSYLSQIEQYKRQIQDQQKQKASYVTQIERKRMEYNQLARL